MTNVKLSQVEKQFKINKRIIEIDVLRAIAVFFMIFDHFMYDIIGIMPMIFNFPGKSEFFKWLYRVGVNYWNWDLRIYFREFIIFIFMALTGISCSFSRSNLKRSLIIIGVSLFLTLVTVIGSLIFDDSEMLITFGALHLIGLSLLIIAIFEKFIKTKWFYLITGFVMIGFGIYFRTVVQNYYFWSGDYFNIIIKQIIGLANAGEDTMPLFLYGGEIFVGYFLGKHLYKERKSIFGLPYKNDFLTTCGRNAIWIYFGHQVVLIILLSLILLICGYTFSF